MDETQAAVAESTTAAPEQTTDGTQAAATVPSQQPSEKLPPFHQHPRFQQLTRENATLKSTVAQLNQRLSSLESRSDDQGGLTPEQTEEYRQAASALKRIFAADPELKALFEARKHLPSLAQGYQSVQQLSRQQAQAQAATAKNVIKELAAKEGLPTDAKYLTRLTRLVASEAMDLTDGNERYDRGDFSVLEEAFAQVKDTFIGQMLKEAAAATTATKTKTKQLPPAPRGGTAGEPAPAKIEEGKEREFMQGLHKRGLAMLREKISG